MKRLAEYAKGIIAIVAMALNNTNVTGRYLNTSGFQRIRFWLIGGAMAATKTTIIALYEATDDAGSGAQAISSATGTITANALVTKATVALGSAAATDLVTLNGLLFTMAAATDVTAREFADDDGLALCINNATYGVPGLAATASGDTVTVIPDEPGSEIDVAITVTKTEVAGTITLATVEAQAYVDLDVSKLSNGFSHVAAKVTTTANSVIAVQADGYGCRYTPRQVVGASATL